MDLPEGYLEKLKQNKGKGPLHERNELVDKFFKRGLKIRDRKTGELVPITGRELAVKLSHIPTADLHAFYQKCDRSDNFGRVFWGCLKVRA